MGKPVIDMKSINLPYIQSWYSLIGFFFRLFIPTDEMNHWIHKQCQKNKPF